MAAFDWGAMFKGIGDTFTAGSNAHRALIGERNLKRQLAFDREALDYQQSGGLLSFVIASRQQQQQLITLVIVAVIVVIAIMMIFRK